MSSNAFKPARAAPRRFLPALDRMLTAELTRTVVAVLVVLAVIIVSRKFLNILAKAIEGEVAADTLFILLGLKMLSAFIILLPAALFLAILMVLGRMYRDQEMTIFAASGVGIARLYRALAWFVLPACLAGAYLGVQILPWSESKVQALMKKDEKTADLRGIKAGRFNEFSRGDVILYAEALSEEDGTMKNLFVQSRSGDNNGVIVSDGGYMKEDEIGAHFVVLTHGRRYQGVPGQADFTLSEFEEYAVRIDADDDQDSGGFKREQATPSLDLWRSGQPRELAELQRRLAVPMGALALGLLAAPLSRLAPRAGVYGNVVRAFLIYLVYENLQKISQGLIVGGKISLWLAYAAPYAFILATTLFLLARSSGMKWLWIRLTGRGLA
jgi:lipopolysaccharide export system permease protein